MNREPLIIIAAVLALVLAVVPALQLMGATDFSVDQLAGIELLVGAVGAFAAALFGRTKVYSPATVEALGNPEN